MRRSVRRSVAAALAGAALGYYYGTKAGRERYDAINRVFGRVAAGEKGSAGEKARALIDLSVERARTTVSRLAGSLRAASPPPEPGD